MLILDLDDTIFDTSSINANLFDPAIALIKAHYAQNESDSIIADLWLLPVDVVFTKYDVPASLISAFYTQIAQIDYRQLAIKTFADYPEIRKFSINKILVTTGLEELQRAKIRALGIESDFDAIYIDDPRNDPRKFKTDIFRQILLDTQKSPDQIWVIGDNPESEIKSGKKLGMRTIQRKAKNKHLSEYADYQIESFAELPGIIN